MEKTRSNVTIVGFVGHCHPDKVIELEHLLNSLPYFRVVRREISDDKLWIMKSKGGP